jgi:hypothetical protein
MSLATSYVLGKLAWPMATCTLFVFGGGRSRSPLGQTSPAKVPTVDIQIATSSASTQLLGRSWLIVDSILTY